MIRFKLKRPKPQPLASLSLFDAEVSLSAHIPWAAFLTPSIFQTRAGDLGAVFELEGIFFETLEPEELERLQGQWAFWLQSLEPQIAIYVTHAHEPCHLEIPATYSGKFATRFAEHYFQAFQKDSVFHNRYFLTLCERPIIKRKSGFLKQWNRTWAMGSEKRLETFQQTLQMTFATLKPFGIRLLGKENQDKPLVRAEPLELLGRIVNAEPRSYTYPYEDIATFIPEKQVFIGRDTLHFQGATQEERQFAAILSVKQYAPQTFPGMLNVFLAAPYRFLSTHAFLPLPRTETLKAMHLQEKRLFAAGDEAISQREALSTARDEVASQKRTFGLHQQTLMVFGESREALEAVVSKAAATFQATQLVAVRETLNLSASFFSQIPGNFRYLRRGALIHHENFTDFCPLYQDVKGYQRGHHLGGPLTLAKTSRNTPFYFNLHEKASGRRDDLTKAHTTIIGPSNAGKTVLMATLATFLTTYQTRLIFFDRNEGLHVYVKAMGGEYNTLAPGIPTGFNPCQLPDTGENRAFLQKWLVALCDSPTPLTARDHQAIAEGVDRNYSLPYEKRRLSMLASFFPLDFSGLPALSKYLHIPDRLGRRGELAWLFDNAQDTLNLSQEVLGFDFTHWLSSGETPREFVPLMLYLFHRIQGLLDGRPLGLFLDEGWQYSQFPLLVQALEEALVTWRKLNGFVVFGTQLPTQLARSPLGPILIQNAATQLFLPNPDARRDEYQQFFHLTDRELSCLKALTPTSRQFLLKQGHRSCVLTFPMHHMSTFLPVLSASQLHLIRAKNLWQTKEDNDQWLSAFLETSL